MLIVARITNLERERSKISSNLNIGFVPTMGALHLGHESLIRQAVAENDYVIVSIFVNPLQFGKNEDLDKYPRQLEQDKAICQKLGVNLLFTPSATEMNTLNDETTLVVPPISMMSVLCGKYRQGHFQGVATIVTKLFNLVKPNIAYFGQKDAQQVAIVHKMVTDLHLPVKIKSCEIIREESGLALSSRNQYLTLEEKQEAVLLFNSLTLAKKAFLQGERNTKNLIRIIEQEFKNNPILTLQYAEIVHPKTLKSLTIITESALMAIAAYCSETRLIDNLILTVKKPIIAIDGPAGAGKSTVSHCLAQELGFLYLDTGAMYRAITWLVMKNNIDVTDEKAIAKLVNIAEIELLPNDDLKIPVTVKVNQQEVTEAIRTQAVTANVSKVSAQKAVRDKLVKLQKEYGRQGGIVAEGRDIGTNVFPDAEVKIFLTASPKARAKRRLIDLENLGENNVNLEQLIADIEQRDYLDSTREIAPLKKADNAIEIVTDNLTIEEVINKIKLLTIF
ncbi:bifunctional pantoate--beta-alanine ligase/(d)CMP kinase [Geminocystis sp. GBBB08]|uniref:bifunctional pantoate--beta-alanine ligase/(d)CMP kinase n=1 Tax=Geminocystis sp. GBBB08 TaxID=2604140 RepID=UPI0027E31511|nr:bifunctional pantoate--beta-alanine ligase/(d)CMP kinase [Geminocystis sp. GBBB08]MBL1210841.1 bifunctional pantoate--beta-alanine ligase/(d)CMP kinase [Geminocystis sp. GBBB08]